MPLEQRPVIGVSACLAGEPVRYNGSHKKSDVCRTVLARCFGFVTFCPEMAAGLGVPRAPVRLIQSDRGTRLVQPGAVPVDHTGVVMNAADGFLDRAGASLSGFVLASRSPSCGRERVPLYDRRGRKIDSTVGVFARRVQQRFPYLPCEDAGRLNDPFLREHFVTRVFIHADWQRVRAAGLTRHALIQFYTRHKYQLMAHRPAAVAAIGRALARVRERPWETVTADFESAFFEALAEPPTRRRHTNVLNHIRGYLRGLSPAENRDLDDVIEQYRQGALPRSVPVSLLRHRFAAQPHPYIDRQSYLSPYPASLGLMNGVGG